MTLLVYPCLSCSPVSCEMGCVCVHALAVTRVCTQVFIQECMFKGQRLASGLAYHSLPYLGTHGFTESLWPAWLTSKPRDLPVSSSGCAGVCQCASLSCECGRLEQGSILMLLWWPPWQLEPSFQPLLPFYYAHKSHFLFLFKSVFLPQNY